MRIELLFFAQIKDALGRDREVLEVEDGRTIDDVVASLRERGEWRPLRALPLTFAVNETAAPGIRALRHGDRLALLTPFSGG
jgi:molybdopterin converting factor small subunit